MAMLKFPLHIFQLSLTMHQLQIQTPLQLNKLMMMKWIISWNSSIQNMMKIFWMLTSKFFRLDWRSPLLQNFIHYLLCYFIKMGEQILQSQIVCHTFLCLSQPRPLWNWLMETWDTPKELGYFFPFLKFSLYIQWDQFNIFQVTLPTSSR